jgi:hypothetical protein
MAGIDLDSIPAGMHVLSSMNCRAEGKGPSYSLSGREIDKIILSASGEIGVYHENRTTDSFHAITDLSMVEKVEYSRAEVIHPKRFHLITILSFLVSVGWLILTLAWLYDFVINFDYYYSYQAPMTAKETAHDVASIETMLVFLLMPIIILPFIVKDRLSRWAKQEQLQIQMFGNQQLTLFGEFPNEFRLSFGKFWAFACAFVISLSLVHGEFLVFFAIIEAIFLFIVIWSTIIKKAIFENNDDEIDSRGKGSIGSMNRFHLSINTILGSESSGSEVINNSSIETRLGDRIKDQKRRLEIHKEVLNNLTQKNWSMMLSAPVEYMGMAQIRRCLEKLLTPLVNKLGISIKPKDRGVHTLKNILIKNKAISSDVLRDLEIIEAITNPAAHDFDTSEDNYITSLTSFVNIVDWYAEMLNDSDDDE